MRYKILVFASIMSGSLSASEVQKVDPFAVANEKYGQSNWDEAYQLYGMIHRDIQEGIINKKDIEQQDFYRGHVNFGDVTYAKAVGEYSKGNKQDAKQLLFQACHHWTYRLKARQFGRVPLSNEWDGSDLRGKRIVVWAERPAGGAFGDTFYMTDLLRYVREKGAYVIFVPQKPLAKLYDKNELPALQSQFVDQVAIPGAELPEHDYDVYLWSILKYYFNDDSIKKPFPMQPCLSGKILEALENTALIQKFEELTQLYGHQPFFVGMWWRSAGPAAMAADWRTLDRDPGAHRMLSLVQDLPVLVINLEGMGRIPLSEEELTKRRAEGTAGYSDEVDVTTYPTNNVVNFGPDFDKDIPFADTIGVMELIKLRHGILIGCDTGLCNAAAMVAKDTEGYPEESVLAFLNKRADHRWGTETTSPRKWHHSDDVLVFQAQEQGKWDQPIDQARQIIIERIKLFQQKN